MIYTKKYAETLKDSAGQKYRPSNGSEVSDFMSLFCFQCIHDENSDCKILASIGAYDVEGEEYPIEWQYGEDGQPKCTKFERV